MLNLWCLVAVLSERSICSRFPPFLHPQLEPPGYKFGNSACNERAEAQQLLEHPIEFPDEHI